MSKYALYKEFIIVTLTSSGLCERDLLSLPVGVALPLREAIFHCRCNPPSDWPEEAYTLIGELHCDKHL